HRHPRRPLRDDHDVGHHPGRLLQVDGQAGLPDGAAAAPLRAARVAGGHDRHPLLDHRGALRRGRSGGLLRGVGRGDPVSARATRLSTLTHRDADWAGLRVVVTGLGVSGFAAADALLEHGAQVHVLDATTPEPESLLAQRAQILEVLGARLLLGDGVADSLPVPAEEIDLVVTSPGWPPHQPLLAEAAAAGIPIWGDVELAWRMRPTEGAAPWLLVTGTNGKTTTVQMLASMLRAAGLRAASAGNVGTPVIEL